MLGRIQIGARRLGLSDSIDPRDFHGLTYFRAGLPERGSICLVGSRSWAQVVVITASRATGELD